MVSGRFCFEIFQKFPEFSAYFHENQHKPRPGTKTENAVKISIANTVFILTVLKTLGTGAHSFVLIVIPPFQHSGWVGGYRNIQCKPTDVQGGPGRGWRKAVWQSGNM